MANLTITVADDLLRRARLRAVAQGTSVNSLLRAYLEAFASEEIGRSAKERFLDRARAATSASGPEGRRWARDDLHER